MKGFTPEQAAALRDLRGIWAEETLVVVGAMAIACHLDLRWRQTLDLDLTIAAGIEECRAALARIPGWAAHPRLGHAWMAPANVRVDVIPASPAALASGLIEWPDGHTMSATGLRAAFADAVRVQVVEDAWVRVASPAALVVLKMTAFLDRPERGSDLADLAHLMDAVVGDDDPERWSDAVLDLDLDYDSVGPYLLGRRVGALANAEERAAVMRFIGKLEDPADRSASLTRMQRAGPIAWRAEGASWARLRAFSMGTGTNKF